MKANAWVYVQALWRCCLRMSQAVFLLLKCSTVFPTSGLPPMRLLVTFIETWLMSTVQESSILVLLRVFTCTPPKLLLTPVNCGERCLTVIHSSPCSAGAGHCGTVRLSLRRALLSCWIPIKSVLKRTPTSCLALLEVQEKIMKAPKGLICCLVIDKL